MSKGFARTRAHITYRTDDGLVVPGVTTVLAVVAKPALVHWAWKLGNEGQDYRQVSRTAAEIGTLAHQAIACELRGEPMDLVADPPATWTPEQVQFARNAIDSYHAWAADKKIEPLLIEQPLVSNRWGFGGTLDLLARVNGRLELIDIKTGNGVYPEAAVQLAAYRQLLAENGHRINRGRIIHANRQPNQEYAEFLIADWPDLWLAFRAALVLYRKMPKRL